MNFYLFKFLHKMSLILNLRFPLWFRWKMFAKSHHQKNAAVFGPRKSWNWLSHFHRCNKYQRKTSRIIQNIQVLINWMIEDWLPNIICGQMNYPFSLSCTTFDPVASFFFLLFYSFRLILCFCIIYRFFSCLFTLCDMKMSIQKPLSAMNINLVLSSLKKHTWIANNRQFSSHHLILTNTSCFLL